MVCSHNPCWCVGFPEFRTTESETSRIKGESFRNGKGYVSGQIVAEIEWIREGLEKGLTLNLASVLDFLQKKAESLAK